MVVLIEKAQEGSATGVTVNADEWPETTGAMDYGAFGVGSVRDSDGVMARRRVGRDGYAVRAVLWRVAVVVAVHLETQ